MAIGGHVGRCFTVCRKRNHQPRVSPEFIIARTTSIGLHTFLTATGRSPTLAERREDLLLRGFVGKLDTLADVSLEVGDSLLQETLLFFGDLL